MKKKQIILFWGLGLLLVLFGSTGCQHFPAKGNISLEFSNYKWDPAQHMWQARMYLVNHSSKPIFSGINTAPACFIYSFKQTNHWRMGSAYGFMSNKVIHWKLDPGQRIEFLVPLDFPRDHHKESFDLEAKQRSHDLVQVLWLPEAAPLRIGATYSLTEGDSRILPDKNANKKIALKDSMGPVCWCPKTLSVPTNPPPQGLNSPPILQPRQ